MGKAIGFTCDLCKKFALGSGKDSNFTPLGWFRIQVVTENAGQDSMELCSSKCVRTWATERMRANGETISGSRTATGTRNFSPEAKDAQRKSGLRASHRRGNHEENPNPECPDCLELYK